MRIICYARRIRDKLIFISEYILLKFDEATDLRESIIHDINLRKWTLEAKEQEFGFI